MGPTSRFLSLFSLAAVFTTTPVALEVPEVMAEPFMGRVTLRPVDRSGVRGWLELLDTARGTIQVQGKARGLDPNTVYVTLFYDEDSVAFGDAACTGGPVIVGTWTVDQDGFGTLDGEVFGSFLDYRTASIRLSLPAPVPGNLQSCGTMTRRR